MSRSRLLLRTTIGCAVLTLTMTMSSALHGSERQPQQAEVRWPEGTFLVVNGQPIPRSRWDANWRLRERSAPRAPSKQRNKAMTSVTDGIVRVELVRQAVVREGIVVTDAHRAVLREVYGDDQLERSMNRFDPERSPYPSAEEQILGPILLTLKLGSATGTLAEEIARQRSNRRALSRIERGLSDSATVVVVGPPESLARVGPVHVSRKACGVPLGGDSVERLRLWTNGCVTHHIARALLEQETGKPVRSANDALEALAGPAAPLSEAEARAFYLMVPALFREGDVYEQWTVHFLRKDDPATRRGVRVMPIAKRFKDAVDMGEPFLTLARSYEATGDATLRHEVIPVPAPFFVPWEAFFATGDVYGPVTGHDGARIRWIVERRRGALKPFNLEEVRAVKRALLKRRIMRSLVERADIEIFDDDVVLDWPEDRALPDDPRQVHLRRLRR